MSDDLHKDAQQIDRLCEELADKAADIVMHRLRQIGYPMSNEARLHEKLLDVLKP